MRFRKPIDLDPNPFLFGRDNDLLPGAWRPGEELDGSIGILIRCVAFDECDTISLALEDFLRAEASCAGCRQPAGHIIDRGECDCSANKRASGYDLLLIGEVAYDAYYSLAQASDKGARGKKRRQVLGRLPKPFYEALGVVQDFACYYCACELEMGSVRTPAKAHIEHQDPYEGSFLENLVLSCSRCNTQKGMVHADYFAKTKGRDLTAEQLARRLEIWKAVRAWRKGTEGKAWAAKLPEKL